MKFFVAFLTLALAVAIAGCTQPGPVTNPTCQEYCQTQPHIQCVGSWEISGTYPDCICTWRCSTPQQTCQDYCQSQPHIQCVGSWTISGTYPNCNCTWNCAVTEPEIIELIDRPGDKLCDYHVANFSVGDELELLINNKTHTIKVTKIANQDMVTVIVDSFFTRTFAQLDRYVKLNGVGLYLKSVTYSDENSAEIYIGENKVNAPNDCFGVE